MPKCLDIKSVLIIGSGPIVIGQACEFDYAGTQACRALKEEGYRVILVNANPATIMTAPDLADATYIEPLDAETLTRIIEREKPDALLPTMGGQTALNLSLELERDGILKKYGVKLIGASVKAIESAENRARFYEVVQSLGLKAPSSIVVNHLEEAEAALQVLGLPIIIRPSYTLGGSGGAVVHSKDDFIEACRYALLQSANGAVELSESLLGFKEYELEVVRDKADNAIIVCSIENIDPMGVHTGDSMTVAPQQTLTDTEYQLMRDKAFKIIRAIGVETGGANVQFAVNPDTGEQFVIEMNPRVSRSSALASKATGFPIAKIAAKLAVGYTLDELSNDMTGGLTPASFEPVIDYVVTKLPYFQFNKFPDVGEGLGTQMRSIGEVMAIGRTFLESFMKALDSLERDINLSLYKSDALDHATPNRIFALLRSLMRGEKIQVLHQKTSIDPWFLHQWQRIFHAGLPLDSEQLLAHGVSKRQLHAIWHLPSNSQRNRGYKHVDSCSGEFPVSTNYLYSTIDGNCEVKVSEKKKVLIIGSGPNRIGQGIEFDYACVEAVSAARAAGYEAIMLNSNPETVSTDYDISDKLYFEPVDAHYVLDVIKKERPDKIMLQFGGQSPINMVDALVAGGVDDLKPIQRWFKVCESRRDFNEMLNSLGFDFPAYTTVSSVQEAKPFIERHGYPVLIRPSYVLGGARMRVIKNDTSLLGYFEKFGSREPVQIECCLENAIELDIDAISDGQRVLVAGILEHVEPAGVHSGDSIQVTPPYSVSQDIQKQLINMTTAMASAIGIVGPFNMQVALVNHKIYMLEVNPRASRSLPFLAKSTGVPLARIAMRVLLGESLESLGYSMPSLMTLDAVKVPIFVFNKFKGCDPQLGPEMKSTGEVMGIGYSMLDAAKKAFRAAAWPIKPSVLYLVLQNQDEWELIKHRVGHFEIYAEPKTAAMIQRDGVFCKSVEIDKIDFKHFDLIADSLDNFVELRKGALAHEVCYIGSVRVLQFYLTALANQITSLNSLQNWQDEVIKYATSTDDKARRAGVAGRTRTFEESGAS